jgi:hypothetical protein
MNARHVLCGTNEEMTSRLLSASSLHEDAGVCRISTQFQMKDINTLAVRLEAGQLMSTYSSIKSVIFAASLLLNLPVRLGPQNHGSTPAMLTMKRHKLKFRLVLHSTETKLARADSLGMPRTHK